MKNIRKKLNDTVKEWGNKKTAKYLGFPEESNKNYGLGDLLTTDVNFKRAGKVIGSIAPYWMAYAIADHYGTGKLDVITSTMVLGTLATITNIPSIFGKAGYASGKKLDSLVNRVRGKKQW
ncbi:MAG: hypothetical protein PHD81_04340 [Candidatus Nanoarchaeia archaeon]|nr:hypothetical protein [Candidatus Nanoarchaeia archaeon]MDD5588307.1 hypothetical protein [Candidatus Nanoarchaeia archaeon]